MLKKYLSISLSVFVLVTSMPVNCFAQSADFVTQDTKLIVSGINSGESLMDKGNKLYDRLVKLYDAGIRGNMVFLRDMDNSLGKLEEFKNILEEYRIFLINLNNSKEVLKEFESGKILSFEELAEKYFAEVPDYTKPAILEDYFKRQGIPISEIVGSDVIPYSHSIYFDRQSLKDMQVQIEKDIRKIDDILIKRGKKGFVAKFDFEIVKNMYKKDVVNLGDNLASVKAVYTGFDKYAAKIFSTPESKQKFLQYVWERTLEIMGEDAQTLLKGLAFKEVDGVKSLQLLLNSLTKQAPETAQKSIFKMVESISAMTEEEFAKNIAKINEELTPAKRDLIEDISEFVVDKKTKTRLSKLLLQDAANNIPEGTTLRATAGKAAGAAAKVVTPALLILGSLWILDSIVNVNGSNNTFAFSVSPAEIKHKIKEGTATPEEQFAYYIMPSSAEYIEEDPLQFASVMFAFAEVITNPAVKKLMNDPVMQINTLPASKDIGLNEKLDAEIEKALNNIELNDLQLPRT